MRVYATCILKWEITKDRVDNKGNILNFYLSHSTKYDTEVSPFTCFKPRIGFLYTGFCQHSLVLGLTHTMVKRQREIDPISFGQNQLKLNLTDQYYPLR